MRLAWDRFGTYDRANLANGIFIDRWHVRHGGGEAKYEAYKSGAHPSGCAALIAWGDTIAKVLESLKELGYLAA